MTDSTEGLSLVKELQLSQLQFDYMLPDFPISNTASWAQINPIASSAMERFVASEGPSIMLLQSPSFLDVRSFLVDQLPEHFETSAMVFLPSPWSSQTHCIFELDAPNDTRLINDLKQLFETQATQLETIFSTLNTDKVYSQHAALIDYFKSLSDYLWQHPQSKQTCIKSLQSLSQSSSSPIIDIASRTALFGSCEYNRQSQLVRLRSGALHAQKQQVIALQLESLLSHPELWLELKAVVQSKKVQWQSAARFNESPIPDLPDLDCKIKIVIYADAELIHGLHEMDPSAGAIFNDICELKSQMPRNQDSTTAYLSQLNYLLTTQDLPVLNTEAAKYAIERSTRLAEHRDYLSLYFSSMLRVFRLHQQQFNSAYSFAQLHQCQSLLQAQIGAARHYSNQGFVEKFVHLEVKGKCVAQINGLSVLEHEGVGLSFGEPMRITASVHNGDGEVIDIERKAELGGNIHAKSMMIIQNFINQLLASDHQLPFSSSIVFEQSYSDIDGDSASLAGLLVLLSALSRIEIHQSLAVTGAIDQSGSVLAVGGINEKIEGYYDVCKSLGSHTKQGVVIPATNVQQLCLRPDIVDAIGLGEFHIYPVNYLSEAIALFFDCPLSSPDHENTVLAAIVKRIEQLNNDDKDDDFGWLSRIKDLFSQKTN
ncbi:hypothetical protein DBZ36_05550 [Alginatibacterium sediminis]|uniref:endopeptidase La n=1 Tax=Alginatibacterium sediminis TaxID=2164068 RepID=A0A420EGT0_9ALTE|nr:AAA family ATPase [Alginatibacterium sediminis]RKF19922.1 hypothetical protein DBZ36_05550 [Alginatibacterium sediminis]